jgi:hypothetical protein
VGISPTVSLSKKGRPNPRWVEGGKHHPKERSSSSGGARGQEYQQQQPRKDGCFNCGKKDHLLENVDFQGGALEEMRSVLKGMWPLQHDRKRKHTPVKKSGMLKLGFLRKLKKMSWRRTWRHLLLQQQLIQQ